MNRKVIKSIILQMNLMSDLVQKVGGILYFACLILYCTIPTFMDPEE